MKFVVRLKIQAQKSPRWLMKNQSDINPDARLWTKEFGHAERFDSLAKAHYAVGKYLNELVEGYEILPESDVLRW